LVKQPEDIVQVINQAVAAAQPHRGSYGCLEYSVITGTYPDHIFHQLLKEGENDPDFFPLNLDEPVKPLGLERVLKRVTDITGSLCGLILLSPLMLIVALAVKVSSPGPVVFTQTRLGFKGVRFPLESHRLEKAAEIYREMAELNEKLLPAGNLTPLEKQRTRKYLHDEKSLNRKQADQVQKVFVRLEDVYLALAQLDEPEQEVFGADEVMVETVGFLTGQREHLLGPRREIVHGFLRDAKDRRFYGIRHFVLCYPELFFYGKLSISLSYSRQNQFMAAMTPRSSRMDGRKSAMILRTSLLISVTFRKYWIAFS
jgi:hypothetical protein